MHQDLKASSELYTPAHLQGVDHGFCCFCLLHLGHLLMLQAMIGRLQQVHFCTQLGFSPLRYLPLLQEMDFWSFICEVCSQGVILLWNYRTARGQGLCSAEGKVPPGYSITGNTVMHFMLLGSSACAPSQHASWASKGTSGLYHAHD